MQNTVKRLIPWLEERKNFTTTRAPVFQDGEFRISPKHSARIMAKGAVFFAKRAGFIAMMSQYYGGNQIIIVSEVMWQQFLYGVTARQFETSLSIDHVVEVTSIRGEIGVRMVAQSINCENSVLTFSKEGWNAFIEGVREDGFGRS